ncbi:unnamed protein product [Thelazia callipaeda]|uniref:Trafficking protein particle complex subunit 8 n=1 Tax=Thelazia callipaeda TaxID=103827 RepID=A0A0N5D934_THECL|nr:unnamed protein product [Thelazia callipaeda]
MLEDLIRHGFSPLLAVLTSDGVERFTAKSNLSFTDLLLPFASINCTVKYGQHAEPIGPSYCVSPKWFLSNCFKYYLLLDDISSGSNSSRTSSIFSRISAEYGAHNCYLLKFNSIYDDELTDPWRSHLESKYRGLEKGLSLAKQKVLSKTMGLTDDLISATNQSSLSGQLFSASQNNDSLVVNSSSVSASIHGQCISYDDRENITRMMESMIYESLLPWVEQQMRILNEQVIARRGISKSLTTGVRKWFGAAAAQQTTSITYAWDSGEMQIRRLADMCFIFGLYSYAHQLYQNVRKEFAVDQAWYYNAGALEMAALSYFLSTPKITAKQYPQHYMDDAINFYTTVSLKPILAMRATLLSATMLSSLELYIEACTQLISLTSSDDDLFSGILLEKASVYFGKANMRRKMAFHYVLAGHRMSKAGQKQLAMECYKKALPEYLSKRWIFAEDHILHTLAVRSEGKEEALSWCSLLIRPQSVQCGNQLRLFLKHYLWLLRQNQTDKNPVQMPIPLVDVQNIIVIYGEHPVEVIRDLITDVEALDNTDDRWINLAKAAYCALTGSFAGFRETVTVRTAYTDNSKVSSAPPLERIRVVLSLKNSMDFCLLLKDIHLEVSADQALLKENFIDEISLTPKCDWIPFEFSVIPKAFSGEMVIRSLLFNLVVDDITVACSLPLNIRGPRLNNTKKEMTSVLYGDDHRLCAKVTKERWPLLEIDLPPKREITAFCGQICRFDFSVTNVSIITTRAICIVTDHPKLLCVHEEKDPGSAVFCPVKCTLAADVSLGVFKLKHGDLVTGQSKRLRLEIRAPSVECTQQKISIMCYYLGDNNLSREQRHIIVIDARLILQTSLRLLDFATGACLLQLRNLVQNRSSLLARIKLLRIRPFINDKKNYFPERDQYPYVFLHPLQSRQVEIESEQLDSISFLVSGNAGASQLWFCDEIDDLPEWSAPDNLTDISCLVSPSSRADIEKKDFAVPELYLSFGIFWRASIVNSDSTASTVLGENFVLNPFPAGCSIPSCVHIFQSYSLQHLNENDGTKCQLSLPSTAIINQDLFAFICKISTPSFIIHHNFSEKRSCHIPIQISVTNNDICRRSCTITIHFLDFYLGKQTTDSETNSAIISESLHKCVVPPSDSSNHSPTSLQAAIVANRLCMHARVGFGCTQMFDVRLTVYCPSIYDIGCFRIVGLFDGDRTEVPIHVPSTYITVIDQRV